jgi:formylmethanofuran dehydrogenase subunit E
MSLFRFILYTIIAYIVIGFVRKLFTGGYSRKRQRSPRQPRTSQMVRCETCGTYVAENRALLLGEKGFCSRTCAESKRRMEIG